MTAAVIAAEFKSVDVDYAAIAPMLVIVLGAIIGVLVEAFAPRRARHGTQVWLTTLVLLGAFAALGDTIVAYCRTGVQASHIYYQARYLRRPVVIYDGSFIDWSRRGEEYPVERGTGEGGE